MSGCLDDSSWSLGLDGAPGTWQGSGRRRVVVQGLGFVGVAMCAAVASATLGDGAPAFDVIGVDLDNASGRARVDALNRGVLPFRSDDPMLADALSAGRERQNLVCCWDDAAYSIADVIVIDVPFDVDWKTARPRPSFEPFVAAVRAVARRVQPATVILVETTVPPGTTERIVRPTVEEELVARGLDPGSVHIAHSYERVMPGPGYLSSITDFWRVYAGTTVNAADAAQEFLEVVIDTGRFPLRRLSSTTASETAKVLENTYRATTIALMDEWSRFAEATDVDLFEVVEAIRDRPTHTNIRTPGLGVGGYCLTKDPLFGALASSDLFDLDLTFPLSIAAVEINRSSPLAAAHMALELLDGAPAGRRILLCGATYRPGVGDTRSSPSETFARALLERGAKIDVHDPLVTDWTELDLLCLEQLPVPDHDLVVFAVPHPQYRDIDMRTWLSGHRPAVLDAFDVLDPGQRAVLVELGCRFLSVGRGSTGAGADVGRDPR